MRSKAVAAACTLAVWLACGMSTGAVQAEATLSAQLGAASPTAAAPRRGATRAPSQNARQDYPTTAVADYVLGCMKANAETREMLERCSCSIDVITTLIPYSRYEEAETYLSIGQVQGERGVIFRTSELAKDAVGDLKRAQIEAELRCF